MSIWIVVLILRKNNTIKAESLEKVQ